MSNNVGQFLFFLITSGVGLCEFIFSIPHKVLTDQNKCYVQFS